MKSGTSFLLAARQCEIVELEQLAQTGELVAVIARLVHALQRERGLTAVFLASQGTRSAPQRLEQVAACQAAEEAVRQRLEQLDTAAGHQRNGARLFSRVAVVLHALEGLHLLRERVANQRIASQEAAAGFTRLVAGLMAVVFEAADSATDPQVSRGLVALFNFMQAKEFAGQERAFGARVFAAGAVDQAGVQQWQHLVAAQQAALQTFLDFADPPLRQAELASREAQRLPELERLRRLGCSPGLELDPHWSEVWFDTCTGRIDVLKQVEDATAEHLRHLCEARILQARAELRDQRAMLETLTRGAATSDDPTAPARYGPQLERSILAMVQEQQRRLQAMGDELDAVRASLNERKLVERAKGLLMAHRQMSEDEAYKAMRQMAMNQNRRLVDVAEAVLALADVLPGVAR